MASWHDEYLAALHERDRKEKACQDIYNQYTKLADRTATLDRTISSDPSQAPEAQPVLKPRQKDGAAKSQPHLLRDPAATFKIRQDLSEAQRSKGEMQARLQTLTDELQGLKMQSKVDSRRISELTAERATLITRIRDRDEELRGKAKLLVDVQDETVSLNLQLHMAEQHSEKLKRENKELVDRWMARMGEEADAMNNASKFS